MFKLQNMSKSIAVFSRFALATKLKESLPSVDFIDIKQTGELSSI